MRPSKNNRQNLANIEDFQQGREIFEGKPFVVESDEILNLPIPREGFPIIKILNTSNATAVEKPANMQRGIPSNQNAHLCSSTKNTH